MVEKKLTIDMFVKPSKLKRSEVWPSSYLWPDEAYHDNDGLARMPDGRYLPLLSYTLKDETGEEFPMIYEPWALRFPEFYGYVLPGWSWLKDYEDDE